MMTAGLAIPFERLRVEQPMAREQEKVDQFTMWFSRCRKTLLFLASRILNGSERAERAVENCRIRASRNPPGFGTEGNFRSWITRILIEEALRIVQNNRF